MPPPPPNIIAQVVDFAYEYINPTPKKFRTKKCPKVYNAKTFGNIFSFTSFKWHENYCKDIYIYLWLPICCKIQRRVYIDATGVYLYSTKVDPSYLYSTNCIFIFNEHIFIFNEHHICMQRTYFNMQRVTSHIFIFIQRIFYIICNQIYRTSFWSSI